MKYPNTGNYLNLCFSFPGVKSGFFFLFNFTFAGRVDKGWTTRVSSTSDLNPKSYSRREPRSGTLEHWLGLARDPSSVVTTAGVWIHALASLLDGNWDSFLDLSPSVPFPFFLFCFLSNWSSSLICRPTTCCLKAKLLIWPSGTSALCGGPCYKCLKANAFLQGKCLVCKPHQTGKGKQMACRGLWNSYKLNRLNFKVASIWADIWSVSMKMDRLW